MSHTGEAHSCSKQQARGDAVLAEEGDQQVLAAHVGMLERAGLGHCEIQHPLGRGAQDYPPVRGARRFAWPERPFDARLQLGRVYSQAMKGSDPNASTFRDQAEEKLKPAQEGVRR